MSIGTLNPDVGTIPDTKPLPTPNGHQ